MATQIQVGDTIGSQHGLFPLGPCIILNPCSECDAPALTGFVTVVEGNTLTVEWGPKVGKRTGGAIWTGRKR